MGGCSNSFNQDCMVVAEVQDVNTHIEYITIATLGNAQDFGDLSQSGMDGDVGAVSSIQQELFWWWTLLMNLD